MQQLGEREFGYDKERLGFPSVSACRAYVFLTTRGLFGFHNLGNNNPKTQWKPAARAFADYVANRPECGAGLHFYVASKVTTESAYGDERAMWKDEAKTLAKALNFKGPISGYNLSVSGGSKYVEFRATGSTCVILVKDWTRDDTVDQVTKTDYVTTPDHVMSVFGKKNMPKKDRRESRHRRSDQRDSGSSQEVGGKGRRSSKSMTPPTSRSPTLNR